MHLLAVLDLDHFLRRHERLTDRRAPPAGARSSSIFRWISERTLFSCPAVVWIAYQRCSIGVSPAKSDGIQLDEHALQDEIEQRDEQPER